MRKQQNGLSAIVQQEMGLNIFEKALFLFLNRKGTILRMFYWDDTGFAIWSKTLERDVYRWPHRWFQSPHLNLSSEQVEFLLHGADLVAIKNHKPVVYEQVF